jgi:aldehyde:ferredoxin oxidoreductase
MRTSVRIHKTVNAIVVLTTTILMMLHSSGPLLSIDVCKRKSQETTIDGVLEEFIGGRGVGTVLAHERIPFDVGPFSQENRVFFTTGPMQVVALS